MSRRRILVVDDEPDARQLVKLALQSDDLEIIEAGDGMSALRLAYEIRQRGLWVPISSLREGRRGLWSLYVVETTPAEQRGLLGATHVVSRRMVEVLDIRNDQAFINGSIEDGEYFVTRGAHKLVPGQPVRLDVPSNLKS